MTRRYPLNRQKRNMINVVPSLCRPNVRPLVREDFSSVRIYRQIFCKQSKYIGPGYVPLCVDNRQISALYKRVIASVGLFISIRYLDNKNMDGAFKPLCQLNNTQGHK